VIFFLGGTKELAKIMDIEYLSKEIAIMPDWLPLMMMKMEELTNVNLST